MNIHEYQAKKILAEYGIAVPVGEMAESACAARESTERLGGSEWMVKAQVHCGGRGRAGGIKRCLSHDEVEMYAHDLLGSRLVTAQTAKSGVQVSCLYIEKAVNTEKEFYLAVVFDRSNGALILVVSDQGGADIESVAANAPSSIRRIVINPVNGPDEPQTARLAEFLQLDSRQEHMFSRCVQNLFRAFTEKDATLIEINPLAVTAEGDIVALDAKMTIDDNALFRQQDIASMRDLSAIHPLELKAEQLGMSYVHLDGDIGCMVNGAGLAMATMDIIKYHGGEPANFLDVGGGATADTISGGLEILLLNMNVRSVFVNIFGGIVRCDRIAEGIVTAGKSIDRKLPLIVRLAGTNLKEAMAILEKFGGPNIIIVRDLTEGAEKAVSLSLRAEGN